MDTRKALSKAQALVQLIQKNPARDTKLKGKTNTEVEEQREPRSSLFRAEAKVTPSENRVGGLPSEGCPQSF